MSVRISEHETGRGISYRRKGKQHGFEGVRLKAGDDE
jgi:hypothetical protein